MSYKVQEGDVVTVHYVGSLDDGSEFDNSYQTQNPLTFTVGEKKLIPGFENAVLEREKGEEVTVKIPKEEAYGEYSEKNIHEIPNEQISLPENASAGASIEGTAPNGERFICKIVSVNESTVTLDLNSPLAGKDLSFKIEIVDVKEKESAE